MLFLLLKSAKDSSYSLVILFDSGTGHTYKESSPLRAKDGEHKKRFIVMFVKITNFLREF